MFLEHLDLAMKTNEQILIHTPHLEDKYQGTRMILDMLVGDRRIDHSRVLVDHVEEHTIREVLDRGFWAGMTLYPVSKCTPERAVDMVEIVWAGAAAGQFGRRLGAVEADRRARLHSGHAAARPSGEPDPASRLREPAAILQPEPRLPVHAPRRAAAGGGLKPYESGSLWRAASRLRYKPL